jgi:hypothetical protein
MQTRLCNDGVSDSPGGQLRSVFRRFRVLPEGTPQLVVDSWAQLYQRSQVVEKFARQQR